MCGDLCGDLAAAATAGVAGSALEYRSVEDYRIDRLNYRLGDIANRLAFLIGVAEVICRVSGAEDIYIAFASVQYHMLIKDRYALEFLRLAAACAHASDSAIHITVGPLPLIRTVSTPSHCIAMSFVFIMQLYFFNV